MSCCSQTAARSPQRPRRSQPVSSPCLVVEVADQGHAVSAVPEELLRDEPCHGPAPDHDGALGAVERRDAQVVQAHARQGHQNGREPEEGPDRQGLHQPGPEGRRDGLAGEEDDEPTDDQRIQDIPEVADEAAGRADPHTAAVIGPEGGQQPEPEHGEHDDAQGEARPVGRADR